MKELNNFIMGVLMATGGKIGFLDVTTDSLKLGEVNNPEDPNDPWAPGEEIVRFYERYFFYRINGDTRGEIRELASSLYNSPFYTEGARVTNIITPDEDPFLDPTNVALTLRAANANTNIALNILEGDMKHNGAVYFRKIRGSSTENIECNDTDHSIWITGGLGKFVRLPANAKEGREINVTTINNAEIYIYAGNGNGVIHSHGDVGSGTSTITFNGGKRFVFDGDNWYGF